MEEVIKVDFLTNLDFLLKENKITRADLAREIGISPSTINVWYHRGSENISIKILKDISKYFNVSLEALLYGDKYISVYFTELEHTKEELKLLANYSKFLKESRQEVGKNSVISEKI